MGILDDVINGAESIASDMESLVEHSVSELESLGINVFGSVRWLVKYLIELGEDPVYILSRLIAHITSIGGDTVSTLEEIAQGIMTYGQMGFLKRKVEQALTPLRETLQKSGTQGQAIADVHHTTLSTMQSQLEILKTGIGSPDMAWQGQGVEAMSASFDSISKVINELSDQIAHDGTQAALNHACLMALEGIAIIATGLAIIDVLLLIASAVVVVATDGLGAIVVAPVDAATIAGQIELILTLAAADLLAWLLGTLAIYAYHQWTHSTSAPTASKPQILQLNLPKGPEVTPEQQAAIEDLVRELAARLGVSVESLQKWLQLIAQALGVNVSGEALKSIIHCLVAKGYLDASVKSGWNTVGDHLTPRDLQGAWGDHNGYDTSADHWGEINGGLDSLRKYITSLNEKMADYTISPAKRAVYKTLRDAAQKTMDYVTNLINKGKYQGPSTNNWPDPKGRVPFVEDVLKASGCVPP